MLAQAAGHPQQERMLAVMMLMMTSGWSFAITVGGCGAAT